MLGFRVTCGVKMMSLRRDWGWQPTQTAFCIHIRYTKWLRKFVCCTWAYGSILKQLYAHYLVKILMFWVTWGVKMMSLHHGWGRQPTQTASPIHIGHIQFVWAHWYAVHGHMAVASNSYTRNTWVRFWGSGSLVESSWCHYIMIEADTHLKLFPPYILDLCKVFEHIDVLSVGIRYSLIQLYPHYLGQIWAFRVTCGVKMMAWCHCWGREPTQTASSIHIRRIQIILAHSYAVPGHMAVASNSYTNTTWLRFWGSG